MITYETFCGSTDAQETVADALSTVIAEEYSEGLPFDPTHTLRASHCDVASWTLHYFFGADGTFYTEPVMSRHDVGIFRANGGVGWHALLRGLPDKGLGKVIDATPTQFFDLVGLDSQGYDRMAQINPRIYNVPRIAVFDADKAPAFGVTMGENALEIASMTDRSFDVPCYKQTHGQLVGQSRENIVGVFSSIWDLRSYEPVTILPNGHRERQTQRLAREMLRFIS